MTITLANLNFPALPPVGSVERMTCGDDSAVTGDFGELMVLHKGNLWEVVYRPVGAPALIITVGSRPAVELGL